MGMNYTLIDAPRQVIHDEILDYLRRNLGMLRLRPPDTKETGPQWAWFEKTKQAGKRINDLVTEVYERVVTSNAVRQTTIPVNDGNIMNAFKAYEPLKVQQVILEEILDLVRLGILIHAGYKPKNEGLDFNFAFEITSDCILISEYGVRFLEEQTVSPYFAEKYLNTLERLTPLDMELHAYLTEGMACLRNRLPRAAAILLRCAIERTLDILTDALLNAVSVKEREKLTGELRRADKSIEKRAEMVFKKLDSGVGLLPDDHLRNEMNYRLRAAFHSIRTLGGQAAHPSSIINLSDVADNYTLYAGSVYAIIAKIVQHLQTMHPSS